MSAFLTALSGVMTPQCLLPMLACCVLGIIFGALPGLSGTIGVTLLLPLTFAMDSNIGMSMLIAIWVGGVSGGFISATLIGIPGTTSSIATCYDAYPLSKKGQTTKALGVGIFASFIGTFFSCVIAMLLSPYIAKVAVLMGPWEIFSLCICAIVLVVSMSKDNIYKGLGAASMGLLFSSVGMAPIDAYKRLTFGTYNLYGGIDRVGLMLGLFAVCIVVMNYVKKDNDYVIEDTKGRIHGLGITLGEIKSNLVNMIRSFLIGLWIGFLPGMGAGLSNMVAYAQAQSASKHPETFGKGNIEGIFASETSNNASVGGALIPMSTLGIPGDATTAVLLGGLIIHGLEPGPLLFTNAPSTVYCMYIAAIVAAVFVFALQFAGMRLFPKILKIPYHYLYPTILVFCFVGAFSSTNNAFNIWVMLFFGAFGILMTLGGLPRSPFILAFVLGKMIEQNLRRGLSYSEKGVLSFLTRPVSAVFLAVALFSLVLPIIRGRLKRKT